MDLYSFFVCMIYILHKRNKLYTVCILNERSWFRVKAACFAHFRQFLLGYLPHLTSLVRQLCSLSVIEMNVELTESTESITPIYFTCSKAKTVIKLCGCFPLDCVINVIKDMFSQCSVMTTIAIVIPTVRLTIEINQNFPT